jgi:diguanylate cyclase (GGDEF)-like protein
LKDINDAHGRRIGDDLLKAVARRLLDVLPPGGFCGRFDSDEFAVAITTTDSESAETAVTDMTRALARPYWIADQVVQVGLTAGLAHVPRDGQSRDELIRRADLALRGGKRKQRGGVAHFEPAMEVEFNDRRFLEKELRRALEDKTLDVHHQPIVASDGARIVGAEALLRWAHPVRGAVPPVEFVAVAEHCGLMARLGDFVLRRALADAARWPGLYMAVNLSPVQVRDPTLVETVADLLAEYRLPAGRLVLEVTEGVLIDKPDEAKVRLEALQALGVRLALDDFGTGYSSLTYLQKFKFDKLKIDKGFVDPLGRNPEEMQGFLFARLFARPGPREALDRPMAAAAAETQRPAVRAAGA